MPAASLEENLDIVFVAPVAFVPAHGIGGVQRIVQRQARWLAARGHRVRVLTTAHPDGLRELNHDGVAYTFLAVSKVGRLPGADSFTVDRWRAAILAAWPGVVHASRPDVVHGHAEAESGLVLARRIGRGTGVGLVSTLYGSPGAGLLDHARIRGGRRGVAGLMAAARGTLGVLPSFGSAQWIRRSRVIALSYRHARFVRTGYGPRHLHVVSPGVDTLLFHPAATEIRQACRARLGLPQHAFIWGIVGRAAAGKGVDVACRAVAELATRGAHFPPDHLLVAGTGGVLGEIAAFARAGGIEARVHLAGDVDPPAAAYVASDAIVFPTAHEESFGLAALEAMACGRAVLATRRGAVPEVLGGTGVLISSRDGLDWAAEMGDLRGDVERRLAMEAAGRKRALARYARGRAMSAVERVYGMAIRDANRP